MKHQLQNYLTCTCLGKLEFSAAKAKCSKCGRNFKMHKGIPILIDLKNLPEHLRRQVDYFEKEEITQGEKYELFPWQERYVERFLENFQDVEGKLVIDCGTGTGYMAIELAKKGANVIVCDLTLKVLVRLKKIAEEQGVGDKLIFVCCSAEELPFKDTIADYFISNAVLEHLPRESEAIQNIERVTKEGAGVMIVVPLKYRFLNPWLVPLNLFHDRRIGHLRRYDEIDIKSKFGNFKIKRVYYTGHFKKVIKVVANHIYPIFDETVIEIEDFEKEKQVRGASNICTILVKDGSKELIDATETNSEYPGVQCLKCSRKGLSTLEGELVCSCGAKYQKREKIPVISLKEELELFYDY